jgi:arylsulfatase
MIKESPSDFPKEVEAPKCEPNVLRIMADDVGFAAFLLFSELISTPAK